MSKNKKIDKALTITWALSNPIEAYKFAKSELEKKIKKSKLRDKKIPQYFEHLNTLNINSVRLMI